VSLACTFATLCLGCKPKARVATQIVKKVKVVVYFIQQHHVPLIIFHHNETNLMLLNPLETCFATKFLMGERLFKLKPIVEQTIANFD
jgi:hypothetical protein